jgi:hypothetical protein
MGRHCYSSSRKAPAFVDVVISDGVRCVTCARRGAARLTNRWQGDSRGGTALLKRLPDSLEGPAVLIWLGDVHFMLLDGPCGFA